MKVIKIGGKEYKFEFTIEASLYDECTVNVTSLLEGLGSAKENKDTKSMISSLANIPQTALSMFYAGLLEHHGEDGDGSIANKKEAKKLIKKFFDEHKEDGKGNFYEIMEMMLGVMEEDGFFELIGLSQVLEPKKQKKVPQDHKKPEKAIAK